MIQILEKRAILCKITMSGTSHFLRRVVRLHGCICRYSGLLSRLKVSRELQQDVSVRYHQAVLHRSVRSTTCHRYYSTEPLPLPNQDAEKQYSPKIQEIVDNIGQLTLLEVADLNELLKKTLKIQDAPVMAMGAGPMAAQAKEEEEDVTVAAPKKSTFNVKLTGFDADKKIALIKEIKALLPDTNLVQAKKFVESAPVVVRGDLLKEEAEELVKALEKVGGKTATE